MAKGQLTGKELIADDVLTRLDSLDEGLLKILSTYNELIKKAQLFNTPKQGNQIISQRNSLDGSFLANQKEKVRLLKAVERQEAKNAQATSTVSQELAKQRFETQKLNALNKRNAILTSKFADAYDKLGVEVAKAKRELKNLTIEQGKNSDATKKAQIQYDKLNNKIRQADAVAGDFQRNVGNYPNTFRAAIGGLKQLVGAFGAVEAIRIAFSFGKEAVELAKQAKGVDFAFQRLGETGVRALENVKASTRGLLSELDIKTALVDFDNFNISLDESATLFEFLAVRSAQTGKSIDSLKDSLVEGLSKESKLRIDNLGISAAQLNDELSKTPNFVKAVANIAKTEIAEAGNILDEAANSTEAFNASWENLKLSIGDALSQIQGSSTVVNIIDRLTEQQKALNISWKNSTGVLERYKIQLNILTAAGRERNRQIVEEEEARKKLDVELNKNIKSYKLLSGVSGPLREIDQETRGNGFTLIDPQSSRTIENINDELQIFNEKLLKTYNNRDAQIIQDKIKGLEAEKNAILGVAETKTKVNKIIEGTISAYQRDIAEQENFIKTTATTTEEIKQAELAITQLQGKIDELRNGAEKILKIELVVDSSGIVPTDEIRSYTEAINENLNALGFDLAAPLSELERYNNARINGEKAYTEFLESEREKQRDLSSRIMGELFGTFAGYYQLDLGAFHDLLEGKKGLEIDYAATINSIANSILNGKLEKYSVEEEKNREVLDAILNDKNASDKKREQAQIEFDKREAELRNKKAKAERDAILFQISVDTAQSVTKALLNAYSLLSNPVTAALAANSFAQAAIAGAFGAAQLAFVSSKALPQYFLGKEASDNYQGWASVNELNGQREVKIDQYGGVTPYKAGMQLDYVKSDDIIMPSMARFDREIKNPNSEVFKRVSKRYRQDTVQRTSLSATPQTNTKSIERTLEKVLSKYMDKPFNIHNDVKLVEPRKKYHRG